MSPNEWRIQQNPPVMVPPLVFEDPFSEPKPAQPARLSEPPGSVVFSSADGTPMKTRV